MKTSAHFRLGQRVLVRVANERIFLGGVPGTVVRLRRADNGAWVALDEVSSVPGAHPFPSDDPRGCHVLTYPEHCSEGEAA